MPDPDAAGALLDLLDDATLDVLAIVSLADGHLDDPSLVGAAGTVTGDGGCPLTDLEQLALARRTPDGRVIVAHAYVRQAVLDRLPAERRRLAHARTAAALDAAGADASLVSAHIEAAADPLLVSRGLQLAAEAARASLAVGEIGAALDALARIERLAGDMPLPPLPPALR